MLSDASLLTTDAATSDESHTRENQKSLARSTRYIVGRGYDWGFFLLAPLIAVVLGALVSRWPEANEPFWLGTRRTTLTLLLLGSLVHAHLVAVFARSHLDRAVYQTHRGRCTVLPVVVLGVMFLSDTAMVAATVLVVFWDVYHSAMQTFGLARFYDRLEGNHPDHRRLLDMGLNLILYIGPIVSGASLVAHLQKVELLEDTALSGLTTLPAILLTAQPMVTRWVWLATAVYIVAYVAAQVVDWRRGHVVSAPKVFLLTTTGACSLWVWATNPWGMAFFIMNLFHAVQYLALVWWKQRSTLIRRAAILSREEQNMGGDSANFSRRASLWALLVFGGFALMYGVIAEIVTDEQRLLWCVTQTVALMHFYYDGFIWSVRKQSALGSPSNVRS